MISQLMSLGFSKYVGGISRIQIGQTRVFSIGDPHFAPFSDMSMGHKISHGRIYALIAEKISKVFWMMNPQKKC